MSGASLTRDRAQAVEDVVDEVRDRLAAAAVEDLESLVVAGLVQFHQLFVGAGFHEISKLRGSGEEKGRDKGRRQ